VKRCARRQAYGAAGKSRVVQQRCQIGRLVSKRNQTLDFEQEKKNAKT
jgi:hypothetical protein